MYGYGISTFSLKHHKEDEHRNGKEDETFAMHVDTFALESWSEERRVVLQWRLGQPIAPLAEWTRPIEYSKIVLQFYRNTEAPNVIIWWLLVFYTHR